MSFQMTAVGIVIMSALHFAVAAATFMVSYGMGMERFDTGAEPTIVELVCDKAASVLFFPGFQIYQASGIRSNAFQWAIVIGNSVLWGTILTGVIAALAHTLRRSENSASASGI